MSRSFISIKIHKFLPGAIILAASIIALISVWHDSIIIDEDPHIGAGYSYLVQQDMRLNPEHPPLAKDLAALPLLFLNLNQQAFFTSSWTTTLNGQWDFGRALIFNTGNDADLIAHAAKIAMLGFFILSSWLVFRWTNERYGLRAAYIALILFAFSPTIMAHARFVTTDVAALTGILVGTYTFLRYLKNPTRGNLILAGVGFGFALLTKFSTILLLPLFVIIALLWGGWRPLANTVMIWIIGLVVIVGPVYFFHTYNYPPQRQHRDTETLLASFGNRLLAAPVVWASDKPIIRAYAQYGLGLLMVVQRSAGGNTVYYRGEVLNTGGPGYFPFVYSIKEPLPWLILLLLAIVLATLKFKFKHLRPKMVRSMLNDHIEEVAMLLWLAIYWATSIHSTLNIGVRHLLPTYPFAIILVSGQIARLRAKYAVIGVWVLMGWYLVENALVFPYYLTYFNETVGGPSGGHNYVVDSNLDWGQDLRRFSDWVNEQHIKKIEFDYFGWADQSYYLKDHFLWLTSDKFTGEKDFLARNTSDGWIAVSATYLMNNSKTKYAWLMAHTPVAVIGNSIFVYNISGPRF